MSYRVRLLVLFLATAAVTSGVSIAITYTEFRDVLLDELRSKVLSIASTGAAILDGDRHGELWRKPDESSPLYREIEHVMRRIRDANRREDIHVGYVFTARSSPDRPGIIEFGVDPEESPGRKPHLRDAFRGKPGHRLALHQRQVDVEFTEDQGSHWLSANAPVRDSQGRPVAAFVVDLAASDVIADMHSVLVKSLIGLAAGVLLAAGASTLLSRRVTRPLAAVRAAVEAIGQGKLDTRVDIRSKDEFGVVGRAVNEMAVGLQERERMSAELKTAHTIQMSLLPQNFDLDGQAPQVDLYATVVPAREVGGDLYDFFALDGGKVGFVVGDVSGKGVPASLHMAMTKTLIRAASRGRAGTPAEVLTVVNEELSRDNEACIFVTLFFGVFDPATGEVAYTNAGHNPPLVCRAMGTEWLTDTGMVAGVDAAAAYESRTVRLGPGELLVVYSDGLTEARSADRGLFGDERLESGGRELRSRPSREVVETLVERVQAFAAGAPQSDDITVMAVRYAA